MIASKGFQIEFKFLRNRHSVEESIVRCSIIAPDGKVYQDHITLDRKCYWIDDSIQQIFDPFILKIKSQYTNDYSASVR